MPLGDGDPGLAPGANIRQPSGLQTCIDGRRGDRVSAIIGVPKALR